MEARNNGVTSEVGYVGLYYLSTNSLLHARAIRADQGSMVNVRTKVARHKCVRITGQHSP